MRRNVASTSFRRHVPTRLLIYQCQTITFLIFKSDIIENSRIELRGIVLPAPSNQLKLHFLLFYPSNWYICEFFLFHIEIEGKGGWIIWWGGKGMLAPLSNYWGDDKILLILPSTVYNMQTEKSQPSGQRIMPKMRKLVSIIIRLPSGLDFCLDRRPTINSIFLPQNRSYHVLSSGKNMNTLEIQLRASIARTPLAP